MSYGKKQLNGERNKRKRTSMKEIDNRKRKLENWSEVQKAYPDKFERTHKSVQAAELADGESASLVGRIMLRRDIGGIVFISLRDYFGSFQIAIRKDSVEEKWFNFWLANIDLGDYIGVKGKIFTTKKNGKNFRCPRIDIAFQMFTCPTR
jgi:lysyl-tRNA synthetase class 2